MEYGLIDGSSRFDAAILAAGDFPKNEIAVDILRCTTPLLVCDSALTGIIDFNKSLQQRREPEIAPAAIVGDGDSLPVSLKRKYADKWHQVDEQDYNDLTKTTQFAISNYKGAKSIAYLGTTGKREDHTIGNLSLMIFYFREFGLLPTFITDYGWFSVAKDKNTFKSFTGQQVSIFNFDCKTLESEGLKWNSYAYKELWQGTLNEAAGSSFTLDGDGIYVVFRTFDKKEKPKD